MYLHNYTTIIIVLTCCVHFSDMPRGRPKKLSSRKKRSSSAPPVMQSPKKRLKWNYESMEMAIRAVKDGRCEIKEAAREYDVARTTLQDRLKKVS